MNTNRQAEDYFCLNLMMYGTTLTCELKTGFFNGRQEEVADYNTLMSPLCSSSSLGQPQVSRDCGQLIVYRLLTKCCGIDRRTQTSSRAILTSMPAFIILHSVIALLFINTDSKDLFALLNIIGAG